jgi:hypothetical protein
MTPERRKQIEIENKQLQDEYDAKVKLGREKAKRLNAQYAKWFYVVSDATYQDLNLDPLKLVEKKPQDQPAPGGAAPPPGGFQIPGLNFPPQ